MIGRGPLVATGRFLIAPKRGSNIVRGPAPDAEAAEFLIAPKRGSNRWPAHEDMLTLKVPHRP